MTIQLSKPIECDIVSAAGRVVGVRKISVKQPLAPVVLDRLRGENDPEIIQEMLFRAPNADAGKEDGSERLRLSGIWTVRKFESEEQHLAYAAGDLEAEYSEDIVENGFLTAGITELWSIFVGANANTASSARMQIGIGDSATAFSASQTGLQSSDGNTYFQAVDSGYPSVSGSVLTALATIAYANANYAWNEMCLKNSSTGTVYNRAINAMGTKTTSGLWTAQCAITAA